MWKRDKAERNFFDKALSAEPAPAAPTFSTPSPVVPTPPSTPAPVADATADAKSDAKLDVAAAGARRPASLSATSPKGSVLGATLRFKGDLVADEDLVVQGQIEGSILHSRSLTIGPDGAMKGDIRARRIVIEGTMTGDLYALECVTVRSTGHVRGNIYAPRVAIAEGAHFNGKVDMAHAPAVPVPVASPETSAVRADTATAASPADVSLDDVDVDDLLDAGDKGL